MTYSTDSHSHPLGVCSPAWEDTLNSYLDGELSSGHEATLFAHLAVCDACRRQLGAVLEFRRMSRQESFPVPAAVDDAFFNRLDQVKRRADRVDRWADRLPLWQSQTPVSLRMAAVAAVILFFAGLLFPRDLGQPKAVSLLVEGLEERVEFAPPDRFRSEAVYVFYPGLTVEAARIEERTPESM